MLVPLAASAQDALTANEIRILLTGNTVYAKTDKNRTVFIYYDPNGTMQGWNKQKNYRDQGTWDVSDDHQYCRKWKRWWKPRKWTCSHVYPLGDDKYFWSKKKRVLQFLEGDPKNLKVN